MSAKVVRTGILTALVILSVVTPLAIWHFSRIEWRNQNARLREQEKQLSDLKAEQERLSGLLKRTNMASSLTQEQFNELLRLRGEIGFLRQAAEDVNKLRAINDRLSARAKEETEMRLSMPDPAQIQAYWPRGQLAYSGYMSPASALETTLWAMNQDDTNALLASVTAEARTNMAKAWWKEGNPDTEIIKSTKAISASLQPSSGFYVTGENLVSSDLAILDVFFAGEGKTRKIAMRKEDGEWKFSQLGPAGWDDAALTNGYRMWP